MKIAEFTNVISTKAKSFTTEYQDLHDYYTNIALNILNNIHSDHAALIVLECPTDLEPKTEISLDCFQIAIRSENAKFISNDRVMSILNGIWETSSFLNGQAAEEHFSSFDRINFLILLRSHYRSVPAMPCGKYAIQLFLFIVEVGLLSYFALQRLTLDTKFDWLEAILWLFGCSSFVESVHSVFSRYRLFRLNVADLSRLNIGFLFAILASIRFYYLVDIQSHAEKEHERYLDMQLVFDTVYAMTVILAYVGVSTLFGMNKAFGSLMVIVGKMTADFANFAWLWVLLIFGFVYAEYYYVSTYLDEDFEEVFFRVFAISAGGTDADFDLYQGKGMTPARQLAARIMLLLLVIGGALLLINLFIAMMAVKFFFFCCLISMAVRVCNL